MLISMTGHGESRREGDGFEIHVEVRAVNNRFLRVVTKISDELAGLQATIEELVRKKAHRGTVFVTIRLNPTRRSGFYHVDEEVLRSYHERLNVLSEELDGDRTISIRDLLLLPGAMQTEDSLADHPEFGRLTREALAESLDQLNTMRKTEGEHLETEFHERTAFLGKALKRITDLASVAVNEYQQRLEERVRQLLAKHEITLNPEDIIKEVAILSDRSDISEEISRMASHLKQFEESLSANDPIGRKLEFLLQEMFREANTMASKSIHTEMNRILVEYRSELDRLKEQVQNVE